MLKIYSIRDKKAGYYMMPFVMKNDHDMTRNLSQVVKDPKGPLNQFPDDFAVYCIAHFDEDTGTLNFDPSGLPVHVIEVSALAVGKEG